MQGKLIILEGIDGSGKSTQYRLLCRRLAGEGRQFRELIFPRYDNDSSALIRMYLGGQFGEKPSDVNAYAASTFYAVDRIASYLTDWKAYYNGGGLILSDRYTTSNAVHQGAKVPAEQQTAYLDWLYDFEFRLLELPKPDLVLYLAIDLETSQRQMAERQKRTHTTGDIHEKDAAYLQSCLRSGDLACSHLGWRRVDCVRGGAMRSVEDIHQELYETVRAVLE